MEQQGKRAKQMRNYGNKVSLFVCSLIEILSSADSSLCPIHSGFRPCPSVSIALKIQQLLVLVRDSVMLPGSEETNKETHRQSTDHSVTFNDESLKSIEHNQPGELGDGMRVGRGLCERLPLIGRSIQDVRKKHRLRSRQKQMEKRTPITSVLEKMNLTRMRKVREAMTCNNFSKMQKCQVMLAAIYNRLNICSSRA